MNSPAGDEAVSNADNLSLAELNEITGLDFKSKEAALKSIRDMQSQAGKASDLEGKLKQAVKEPGETNAEYEERLARLEQENFFARNSEHEANRSLLEKIAKADGISLAQAVESTEYKAIFEAQQSANEAQSKRTVAASNNRVAQGGKDEFDPNQFVNNPRAAAEFVAEKFFKSN